MFRLVFLAFHGDRRGGVGEGHGGAGEGHGGHGAHLHDAPRSMAIPLVLLAAGAVLAGYIGIPHSLGGSNRIESFLEPSFHAATLGGGSAVAQEGHETAVQAAEGHEAGSAGSGLELTLMGVSTAVALGGIAIAVLFFLRRPALANAAADRFQGVYRLLLNKYYVDEIYDAAIVEPVKTVSEDALWKGIDVGVIDGAVNGAGATVRAASGALRLLQSGSLRSYAASVFIGVLFVLGYLLWR
jgi:NADH-quinone oxidoreductase subunit L